MGLLNELEGKLCVPSKTVTLLKQPANQVCCVGHGSRKRINKIPHRVAAGSATKFMLGENANTSKKSQQSLCFDSTSGVQVQY